MAVKAEAGHYNQRFVRLLSVISELICLEGLLELLKATIPPSIHLLINPSHSISLGYPAAPEASGAPVASHLTPYTWKEHYCVCYIHIKAGAGG